MKKYISLLLALFLCLSLCSCGGVAEDTTPTEPEMTDTEDDGILKILLIGHSWGMDAAFLFPDVARNEGTENLVFGLLYHSACRMVQHVDYAAENARQYAYYEYDISKGQEWLRADCNGNFSPCEAGAANDAYIEDGSIAQTLQFGIQRHDWDLVFLEGGGKESANRKDEWYIANSKQLDLPGYTQQLINYVDENDIEKSTPISYCWILDWCYPADPAVRTEYVIKDMEDFGGDDYLYYKAKADFCRDTIAPSFDFAHVLPSGTAIENLKTTKLASAQIYRDYSHVTDFGRLVAAYTWYCVLTDTAIEDCRIPSMNHKVLLDPLARNTGVDLVLTEEQKSILVEAVHNAIQNPYDVTPSQHNK